MVAARATEMDELCSIAPIRSVALSKKVVAMSTKEKWKGEKDGYYRVRVLCLTQRAVEAKRGEPTIRE